MKKGKDNPWSHVPAYQSVHRKIVPVSAYDRFVRNPAISLRQNLVTPFSMEGVYELLGMSAGIVGTPLIPGLILGDRYKGWIKPVSNVATAILLATGAKMIIRKEEIAKSVLWGGLSVTIIQSLVGLLSQSTNIFATKVSSGLKISGLGNESAVRKQLEESVLRELDKTGQPASASSYRQISGSPSAELSYSTIGGRNFMETNL